MTLVAPSCKSLLFWPGWTTGSKTSSQLERTISWFAYKRVIQFHYDFLNLVCFTSAYLTMFCFSKYFSKFFTFVYHSGREQIWTAAKHLVKVSSYQTGIHAPIVIMLMNSLPNRVSSALISGSGKIWTCDIWFFKPANSRTVLRIHILISWNF